MNDQILNFLTQANENPEMQDRIKMMAKGAAEGADVSNFAGEILGMAKKLGFNADTMDIFVGFLDGIKDSLNKEIDVTTVDDDTEIDLDINYEKLYYNMRNAKATWLFKLPG